MGLAETLSVFHGKTVLAIDSDSQASVSSMFMTTTALHKLQSDGLTIVDFLVSARPMTRRQTGEKFALALLVGTLIGCGIAGIHGLGLALPQPAQ